ncbi:MAG: hypothetical protein ACYCZT_10910 [Thiobacillus sp.]
MTLVTARARLIAAAARKRVNPPPSRAMAAPKATGSAVRKPVIKATVPSVSSTWLNPATNRGTGRGEPATTGSICIRAPSITMARKLSVMAWVRASACGVDREVRVSGAHMIRIAAVSKNSGAVRKNRSGRENGGACSKERPACRLMAWDES